MIRLVKAATDEQPTALIEIDVDAYRALSAAVEIAYEPYDKEPDPHLPISGATAVEVMEFFARPLEVA